MTTVCSNRDRRRCEVDDPDFDSGFKSMGNDAAYMEGNLGSS